MKRAACFTVAIFGVSAAKAQPDLDNLGSMLQENPFAKFGSSALDAFSGVSDSFNGLGIGTVFKRIAESSQVTEESPENTAHKFLRLATPAFSKESIEQFLAAPLHLTEGNTKLSSFFEQTQAVAKKKFDEATKPANLRKLQKAVEGFDNFYSVFENVGKSSFLDGKSPEDAATLFLDELSAFPNVAVSSFLSVPSMMRNATPTSFFGQMRDAAFNLASDGARRLQLQQLADGLTDPLQFPSTFVGNLPFASAINDLSAPFTAPLKGIQQIGAASPVASIPPFSMLSGMNPIKQVSAESADNVLSTMPDFAPNSKFLSYVRDVTGRVGSNPDPERRLQEAIFDLNRAQENIAAITFENIAKQASLSNTLNADDAANLWLTSLRRVVSGESVRSFLDNADVSSIVSADGPEGFYKRMKEAAQQRFAVLFEKQ